MPTLNEILNSPIGKKALKIVYPTKKDMNLYRKLEEGSSPSKVIPFVLICILIMALVSKFGVIDRLDKVNELESEYNSSVSQLAELNKELENMSEVKEKYYRNTDKYLSEEQAALVDRVETVNMVSSALENLGTLQSVSIADNNVEITFKTDNLENVSTVLTKLRESENVVSASVYNADKKTDDEKDALPYVESTIVLTLEKKEAE